MIWKSKLTMKIQQAKSSAQIEYGANEENGKIECIKRANGRKIGCNRQRRRYKNEENNMEKRKRCNGGEQDGETEKMEKREKRERERKGF